jgi:hypothetical protein
MWCCYLLLWSARVSDEVGAGCWGWAPSVCKFGELCSAHCSLHCVYFSVFVVLVDMLFLVIIGVITSTCVSLPAATLKEDLHYVCVSRGIVVVWWSLGIWGW